MITCADCSYYRIIYPKFKPLQDDPVRVYWCLHKKSIDNITTMLYKSTTFSSCKLMRETKCGPEAKLFKPTLWARILKK